MLKQVRFILSALVIGTTLFSTTAMSAPVSSKTLTGTDGKLVKIIN